MEAELEPFKRLNRDVVNASVSLGMAEIRFLVDNYYSLQEVRKSAGNQKTALGKSGEPHEILEWLHASGEGLEGQIKRVLDRWTDSNPTSAWAKSITGIGPVIAAGLAAHIDIEQAPTAGHIWRFAGLDPTQEWLGREKASKACAEIREQGIEPELAVAMMAQRIGSRFETIQRFASKNKDGESVKLTWATLASASARKPWNAGLKTLCWKIGESFVKVSGLESDYYGKVYLQRKADEIAKNEAGAFAEQAKAKLERFNIGKDKRARSVYEAGMLPPAHLHSRAKRYAVKLFLSHYQQVAYEIRYNVKPPAPYVMVHGGHAHYIPPPNWASKV